MIDLRPILSRRIATTIGFSTGRKQPNTNGAKLLTIRSGRPGLYLSKKVRFSCLLQQNARDAFLSEALYEVEKVPEKFAAALRGVCMFTKRQTAQMVDHKCMFYFVSLSI